MTLYTPRSQHNPKKKSQHDPRKKLYHPGLDLATDNIDDDGKKKEEMNHATSFARRNSARAHYLVNNRYPFISDCPYACLLNKLRFGSNYCGGSDLEHKLLKSRQAYLVPHL